MKLLRHSAYFARQDHLNGQANHGKSSDQLLPHCNNPLDYGECKFYSHSGEQSWCTVANKLEYVKQLTLCPWMSYSAFVMNFSQVSGRIWKCFLAVRVAETSEDDKSDLKTFNQNMREMYHTDHWQAIPHAQSMSNRQTPPVVDMNTLFRSTKEVTVLTSFSLCGNQRILLQGNNIEADERSLVIILTGLPIR